MLNCARTFTPPGSSGFFMVGMAALLLTGDLRAESPLTILSSFNASRVNASGSFTNASGATPQGALISGSDGCFYGTTYSGGNGGAGTIFKVTTNGALTTLVSFEARSITGALTNTSGANPYVGLTLGSDGNLYGTTDYGGMNGYGTVFKLTTSGVLIPLMSFANTNGRKPNDLTLENDGNIYGITHGGGSGDGGTMFRMTASGTLTMSRPFNEAGLAHPSALVLGDDGNFYGTSANGGDNKRGAVFKATTNGAITVLVLFNGTNGAYPAAGLTKGGDGNFYGTTFKGGNLNIDRNEGCGTVFKVSTNGELATLVSFNYINGARPYAGLTLGDDGYLYGATVKGGSHNLGTVFKVTTNGVLTTLASFSATNGMEPNTMIFGKDGNLYGTARKGGRNGNGIVFKVSLRPNQH